MAEGLLLGVLVAEPAANSAVDPSATDGSGTPVSSPSLGTQPLLPEPGMTGELASKTPTLDRSGSLAAASAVAELEARGMARAQAAGLEPGTPEFGEWWAKNGPARRNVPPMVVEAEIMNPGSTSVRVMTNSNGDVVTVITR